MKVKILIILYLSTVSLFLCSMTYRDSTSNSFLQDTHNDSIQTDTITICDMCKGEKYIFKPCKYCAGTGNAVYVSEYRMKYDIDYWVCEHCRGHKGVYVECPICKKDESNHKTIDTIAQTITDTIKSK